MKMKRILRILTPFAILIVMLAMAAGCGEKAPEYIPEPTRILRTDIPSQTALDGVMMIRAALREMSGKDIEPVTDWVARGEEIPPLDSEIVVGKTNREKSASEYEALVSARKNSSRDWSIVESDGSVLITGASDEALLDAVSYFIANYIDEEGIKVPQGEKYEFRYPYKDITIDGKPLSDYALVRSSDPLIRGAEEFLLDTVRDACGLALNSGEMKITSELSGTGYSVTSDDAGITVRGGTYADINMGFAMLGAAIEDGSFSGKSDISGTLPSVHSVGEKTADGRYTTIGDPVWLIDDSSVIQSGWDADLVSTKYATASENNTSYWHKYSLDNSGVNEPCMMKRPFQPQTDGVLTLETRLTIPASGAKITLEGDGKTAIMIATDNNRIVTGDGKEITATAPMISLRLIADIDSAKYRVFINGNELGEYDFLEKTGKLDLLRFSLDAGANGSMAPEFVYLYRNYPALSRFDLETSGSAPLGCVSENAEVTDARDLRISGGHAEMTFPAVDGHMAYEVKLLTGDFSTASFDVLSGGKPVLSLVFDKMLAKVGDEVLRTYSKNFWYTLRIEPDTRSGAAEVFINGKTLGYFALTGNVSGFDGVAVRSEGVVRIDDLMVFQINDHDDYVPAPVSAGSDGYNVGLQVCSLWRNGYHYGWDCISPFEENRPVLGYYDEGITEVADWEIKYMAEHGIDYQLFCWYSTSMTDPIKTPGMYQALHDGYFMARYSDRMKFAIMWENANATHPGSSDNFRNVIVPYWVEYYLTDPRYMTIDNKPVITVFSIGDLLKDFGSAEGVKAEFDYLRDVCRGLGYDGAIIMVQAATTNDSTLATIREFGADATYAYNWGKANTSLEYENYVSGQFASGTNTVATISVGFNNVAWAGTRSSLIEPDDYKKALEWVRDDFSGRYDKDSWLSRSVILSTWNEYGEGTYIMPSPALHGFDYLEAVREVFAPDSGCENLIPTESQLARLSTLRVQSRKILRADYRVENADYSGFEAIKAWDFKTGANGWAQGFGLREFSGSGGALSGISGANDYSVMSPDNLGIDLTGAGALHVRMKAEKAAGTLQIFFTTDEDNNWDEKKSFHVQVSKAGEYVDYWLPTTGNAAFSGKLRRLRVDPQDIPESRFEIELLEVSGKRERLTLERSDGAVFSFGRYEPYLSDGELYMPFDPKTGLLTFFGCGYDWFPETRTILVRRGGKSVSYTIGKDIGEMDGLPVIPFGRLTDDFGISDIVIKTEKMF